MNVLHVAVPVADLDATKRFYLDGLGFSPSHSFVSEDGLRNVYVRDDSGVELQFTHHPTREDAVPPQDVHHLRAHLAIGVQDLQASFDRVVSAVDPPILQAPGIEAASDSFIAFVEDPDGRAVELVERAPK